MSFFHLVGRERDLKKGKEIFYIDIVNVITYYIDNRTRGNRTALLKSFLNSPISIYSIIVIYIFSHFTNIWTEKPWFGLPHQPSDSTCSSSPKKTNASRKPPGSSSTCLETLNLNLLLSPSTPSFNAVSSFSLASHYLCLLQCWSLIIIIVNNWKLCACTLNTLLLISVGLLRSWCEILYINRIIIGLQLVLGT